MTPPIFCVTLREEPWKQRATAQHFTNQQVQSTFVQGIQGVTVGLRPTNPYGYDKNGVGEYMHVSQMGCVLSHLITLQYAATSGHPEFLVCEDDVVLCDNFTDRFAEFRASLPPDADVAQLAYGGESDKPTQPVNDRVARIQYPFCAACIWWTRSAAQQALLLLRPIDRPFDIILIQRVYPFLNHYVSVPRLATERTSINQWPSAVGLAPKT
jgi:GR25 family glycosyltransferase involved in LPS biosynthesis